MAAGGGEAPQALQDFWEAGDWRAIRDAAAAQREAVLPQLLDLLQRFLAGTTGLQQFVKESSDFAFAHPHWGYKSFAQMQLNMYAKIAQGSGRVDEVERALRAALPAPASTEDARQALTQVVELTEQLVVEAKQLGVGKPAPGRVPLVITYFWEAQDREQWPIFYPASKETLEKYGLYAEAADPAESYLVLREAIKTLETQLDGDVWDVEALLYLLRPKKGPPPPEPDPGPRVWIVRAGENGAHEDLALSQGVAVIGWSALGPISTTASREELKELIHKTFGEERPASLASQAGQVFRFIHEISVDDVVVLPLLTNRGHVAIGRVTGEYAYRDDGPFPAPMRNRRDALNGWRRAPHTSDSILTFGRRSANRAPLARSPSTQLPNGCLPLLGVQTRPPYTWFLLLREAKRPIGLIGLWCEVAGREAVAAGGAGGGAAAGGGVGG